MRPKDLLFMITFLGLKSVFEVWENLCRRELTSGILSVKLNVSSIIRNINICSTFEITLLMDLNRNSFKKFVAYLQASVKYQRNSLTSMT
jgi:hypothetical protein